MHDDKASARATNVPRPVTAPRPQGRRLLPGSLAAILAAAWLALACGAKPAPPDALKKLPAGDYACMNTNLGDMTFRLFVDKTPITAGNFIGLANGLRDYYDPYALKIVKGHFYDGLIFFRLASDFVVQGGDIYNTSAGTPGYCIKDEIGPGVKFDKRGQLAMANSGGKNSAGSQFFITFGPQPVLNGHYAMFGEMVDGEPTLKAIQSTPLNRFQTEKPLDQITLRWARVYHVGADGSVTLAQIPAAAAKAGLPKAAAPTPVNAAPANAAPANAAPANAEPANAGPQKSSQ